MKTCEAIRTDINPCDEPRRCPPWAGGGSSVGIVGLNTQRSSVWRRQGLRNAALFLVTATVLFCVACGGSTSTPPDGVDGSADASGAFDVARDAIVDLVAGDVLTKWQKVGLVKGSGPCPTNSCSSSWDVSPDGHIDKTRLGDAGAAQMTPADLAELDSIVSSQTFVDGMTNGFVCDQPPTDVFVSLRLDRVGISRTQGVTGCVYSGPMGNLPRRVNDLVTKY